MTAGGSRATSRRAARILLAPSFATEQGTGRGVVQGPVDRMRFPARSATTLAMWLLWTLAALAGPADLAPSPRDVTEALVAQHRVTERARALATATFRVHNALGARFASGGTCADPEVAALASAGETFGAGWRDALQSARAVQPILEERAAAPVVAPLLPAFVAAEIGALRDALARDAARYAEAAAWQATYVGPRCDAALAPSPGPAGPPVVSGPVAVIVLEGATLCRTGDARTGEAGTGEAGTGAALVAPRPFGCVVATGAPCDCAPAPLVPGAVLGPP